MADKINWSERIGRRDDTGTTYPKYDVNGLDYNRGQPILRIEKSYIVVLPNRPDSTMFENIEGCRSYIKGLSKFQSKAKVKRDETE